MWELRCLTTLWAFTTCYRDSFTPPTRCPILILSWQYRLLREGLRTLHKINTGYQPSKQRIPCFDVVSLFTNVPVGEVLQVIRNGLSADPSFPECSPLQAEGIMELLDICLTTAHFQFENKFYLPAIRGYGNGKLTISGGQ
jgi:hypothetical protein